MHKDLHLLIVDSPDRANRLAGELRRAGYQPVFTQVANRESMVFALVEGSRWDVVLAGHKTPGFEALAALELLIEMGIEIPLVIVSKTGPDERAVEAMRLGARDFVSMNKLARLAAVVERELATSAAGPGDFREMFEASPLPLWVCDLETLKFLEVNQAAIRHYGYSRDEFLAMTIAQIRPPEDVPLLMQALERVGARVSNAGVWRHRRKDGILIQAEIHVQKLTFRGRPAEMTMIVDVSDRCRREQDMAAQARTALLCSETSMMLSQAQSLREGLQGCIEIVQRHVAATRAHIWILNEAEEVLELEAGADPVVPWVLPRFDASASANPTSGEWPRSGNRMCGARTSQRFAAPAVPNMSGWRLSPVIR